MGGFLSFYFAPSLGGEMEGQWALVVFMQQTDAGSRHLLSAYCMPVAGLHAHLILSSSSLFGVDQAPFHTWKLRHGAIK